MRLAWSVCLSARVLGIRLSCPKTDGPIDILLEADSYGPKEPCIRRGSRTDDRKEMGSCSLGDRNRLE